MNIVREFIPEMTVAEFAELHGLTMVITERRMDRWQRERGIERYIARFKKADIKRECILEGAYGNGNTEAEAIADYARKISGERLVADDDRDNRVLDVIVPRLRHP
jgi:hypothetical protein